MPAATVSLAFGVGVALAAFSTLAITHRSERIAVAKAVAMLALAWGAYKPLLLWFGTEAASGLYPVTDCAQAIFVTTLWLGRQRAWKLALLCVLVLKLFAHVVMGLSVVPDRHSYMVALNLMFALELLIVASVGGTAIGSRIGRWFAADPGRRLLPDRAWFARLGAARRRQAS